MVRRMARSDEPAQDRGGRRVGRCRGRPAAPSRRSGRAPFGALPRTPADRHPHAGVVPERGACGDVEAAGGASIPAADGDPPPAGGRVAPPLREARQPRLFSRQAADGTRTAWRGRPAQAGIEARPGDDGKVRREVAQQGDGREAAAGHRDDAPAGQPAATCSSACWPQSVGVLCRLPRPAACRSEGASTVRKGRPQTQPAQRTGASSMTQSQRRPLALTKWPWLERTGSR